MYKPWHLHYFKWTLKHSKLKVLLIKFYQPLFYLVGIMLMYVQVAIYLRLATWCHENRMTDSWTLVSVSKGPYGWELNTCYCMESSSKWHQQHKMAWVNQGKQPEWFENSMSNLLDRRNNSQMVTACAHNIHMMAGWSNSFQDHHQVDNPTRSKIPGTLKLVLETSHVVLARVAGQKTCTGR